MILPVVFHPAVESEVADAYHWYERRRPGLGEAFLASVELAYRQLHSTLECRRVVYGADVREVLVLRFPYGAYYRINERRVEVIAIRHSHITPSVLRARQ
jgi:toxin ParE1/3/4